MSESEKIDAAFEMVSALCKPRDTEGSRRWMMSIPARPDYDPDLIIAAGLQAGRDALKTNAALVEALKALLDHSDDMLSCAANVRKARAALALAGEAP